MTADNSGLLVTGLQVSFGPRTVIRSLGMEVPRGTSCAVVGPSGVGKTTLLWCLAGLRRPDAGRIVVDGEQVSDMSVRARRAFRRSTVGMVLQGGELVPELTALENVVLGGLLAGMRSREAENRGLEAMSALGLPAGLAKQSASTLSGGERHRVAVARAIVHRPRLLLADEPTSALDAQNTAITAGLLASLPAATGCALVVVTHDERVAACLDTVVRLDAPKDLR